MSTIASHCPVKVKSFGSLHYTLEYTLHKIFNLHLNINIMRLSGNRSLKEHQAAELKKLIEWLSE
jgi:hypothetical protein